MMSWLAPTRRQMQLDLQPQRRPRPGIKPYGCEKPCCGERCSFFLFFSLRWFLGRTPKKPHCEEHITKKYHNRKSSNLENMGAVEALVAGQWQKLSSVVVKKEEPQPDAKAGHFVGLWEMQSQPCKLEPKAEVKTEHQPPLQANVVKTEPLAPEQPKGEGAPGSACCSPGQACCCTIPGEQQQAARDRACLLTSLLMAGRLALEWESTPFRLWCQTPA